MAEEKIYNDMVTDAAEQEFEINMGPQHPSTHGVMRFVVKLKGEIIESIQPHCGYIHRGIEKMCESITYPQIIHLTDRMDYLSAHINNESVCLCVEKALNMEVSDRIKYIRTIIAELNRISSHLLWWSSMCMDMGAVTPYFYAFRDREKILDIFEETTGGRLLYSYNCPGGLMNDIHPNFQKRVKEFIPYFRESFKEYDELITGNVIFQKRTIGIGCLTKEQAIAYGVTGPAGRGSGYACDVRKRVPYSAYDKVQFKEILYNEGDSFARYKVRMDEMLESLNIIEQLIDNIPEGNYVEKMKAIIKLPEGEYFQQVETARGELVVHIISDGNKNPYRVKFRSPCLSTLQVIDPITRNFKIADLIAIGGSLDLVIPDIDR